MAAGVGLLWSRDGWDVWYDLTEFEGPRGVQLKLISPRWGISVWNLGGSCRWRWESGSSSRHSWCPHPYPWGFTFVELAGLNSNSLRSLLLAGTCSVCTHTGWKCLRISTLQEQPSTNDWRELANKWPLLPGSPTSMFQTDSRHSPVGSSSMAHSGIWLDFVLLIGCLPSPLSLLHVPSHCFLGLLNKLLYSKLQLRISAYGGTQTKIGVLLPSSPLPWTSPWS